MNTGESRAYEMGQMLKSWKNGLAKSIMFIVTEDCNLICKYCYLTGKNKINKMNFETAKQAIDMLLDDKKMSDCYHSVIWEFIGGEPFIEIELIDQICDYIKLQMYQKDHIWFNSYRFNFSTNGILYDNPAVQKYIAKNHRHLSVAITIDGTKKKHDLNRVYPDGRGSYDDVLKNVPLWMKQFPGISTKVTFASVDLPYLKESIIHLWDLGLKNVPANIVFENVWQEGDDLIFENQLRELADYILDNGLWKDYSVRFFDETTGHPLDEESLNRNYCGSGKMLAIDYQGNFFPCVRFADYSLNNHQSWKIGDIQTGFDEDRIRPFLTLKLPNQSLPECVTCKVASGCAWCQAHNYDSAESATLYQRATFICKMHKANCRASDYFWTKFKEVTGITSEYEKLKKLRNKTSPGSYLQFIVTDDITPHCGYSRRPGAPVTSMNDEILKKGLAFADTHDMIPVFLTNSPQNGECISGAPSLVDKVDLPVFPNKQLPGQLTTQSCILLVAREDLILLSQNAARLIKSGIRVNITIQDLGVWNDTDLKRYEQELDKLALAVCNEYQDSGNLAEINVLTDIYELNAMVNCEAGVKSFALAPNGKLYLCPAFYFDNPEDHVGSLEEGLDIKNPELLQFEKAPICNACDAFHCQRCKYLNKKKTGEYNTPSRIQCFCSHIERNAAMRLQQKLSEAKLAFSKPLEPLTYMDPLDKIYNFERNSCI